MSLWSRILNTFRSNRLQDELDEEMESHIAEGGLAIGSTLRYREQSKDLKLIPWLEALGSDAVFGWRQLKKNRISSIAAILSLGLAIGACTSAFRLIDALLLRPLPVAHADRLYSIANRGMGPGGDFRISDSSEYPLFGRMRDAAKDSAELVAVSYMDRIDLTYSSDEMMEKANRQYVSGWMFQTFELQPAAGRLLTESDDQTPGAHPVAVISQQYWNRRFHDDPGVVGRKVRIGEAMYEIVGVVAAPFTGTETGLAVDYFVPAMMNPYVTRSDASWFRPLAVLKPGTDPNVLRAKLQVISQAFQQERAKGFTTSSKQYIERFLNQTLLVEPASSGASGLQRDYERPLLALAIFAAMVLLIACANVANLMAAQTASRSKEMALRVSIGAGRMRLIQLVLVESLWLGVAAALVGTALAWWATPFLVDRINPPDNPATLLLTADWRVFSFGTALAIAVTFLFGLPPALRASSVKPVSALKGGTNPHSRSRLMHALIAVQTALCLVVLVAAGLFAGTLDRLANLPLGFSSERLLALDTKAARPQSFEAWNQVADKLRSIPGVESVALSSWPLLSGTGWNGTVWVNGVSTEVLAYFLGVSPEFRDTMKMNLIEGRELRAGEISPSVAIVNEAFVKQCLGGANPIGKYFDRGNNSGQRYQVVGVVRDARYRNLREPITPTAYLPLSSVGTNGKPQLLASAGLLVRTSIPDSLSLASALRKQVSQRGSGFRVSTLRTQAEINSRHTVRERLLSALASFFAVVALLLASLGLHGVLNYSVLQRRREIGIRLAIGAPLGDIVYRVTASAWAMVLCGAIAGVGISLALGSFSGTLFFGVQASDMKFMTLPGLTLLLIAALACLPAALKAIRTDPALMLKSE